MRKAAILVTILVLVAFIGTAFAVPPGKTRDYDGGPMGKIVFDGKKHADAGMKCMDCHPKVFQMKAGGTKVTAPHKSGEFCFTCHDGSKAFNFAGSCAKCHTK